MIAGILARVAFSTFGKQITIGLIVKIILGIIAGVLVWLAYTTVRDHFQHITDLENQVTSLKTDNKTLTDQKKQLIAINQQNTRINQVQTEQRDAATGIGNSEAAASNTRSTKYKEIHDVIKASPVTDKPVDPLILRTLDSVWGQDATENSQ
jgi:hypothetical protein